MSTFTSQISRLLVWLERHPASRAGALALAVSQRRGGSSSPLGRRVAAQIIGSLLVSFGVAVTLATDIGMGPLDVFNIGLAQQFGLPLSVTMWAVAGVMMVIATVLRNPPRPGTLITPFVVGAVLQPLADAMSALGSLPFIWALLVQSAAVAVIGMGAGAIVVSGFGAGLGELISEATSWRFGRSMSATRLGLESSFLVLGTAIGGPFGPGTVLVALLIGPAVSRGVKLSEPLVNGPLAAPEMSPDVSGRPFVTLSTNHRRPEALEAGRGLVHR